MKFKIYNIGFNFFIIGIILLPSALSISSIFLILACVLSTILNSRKYFNDVWNIPFVITTLILIINCLIKYIFDISPYDAWDKNLNIIGLINWIPLFWLFWSSQFYLKSSYQKKIFSYAIISGTIPVLISGILQFHFKIFGPFYFLNELIIWYQRPITENNGITGLFNNSNYAGAWLTTVWPFILSSFLISKKVIEKITLFILIILFFYSIVLTQSRNAIFTTILGTPLILGISLFKISIFLIVIFFILSILGRITILTNSIKLIIANLPENLNVIFSKITFSTIINDPRIFIWKNALIQIFNKPILGWGAASFSFLFFSNFIDKNGQRIIITHSHNLFLEFAQNYGLITSLLIFVTLLMLLFKSYKNIFLKKSFKHNIEDILYYRSFWVSTFSTFILQNFDITYFDGRLSIIFWILFAGIKTI